MTTYQPRLSAEEIARLLHSEFAETFHADAGLAIVEVGHRYARLRQEHRPHALRPGGTISGPTLMQLADVTAFVAILASIGWVPLAVTTSLNINFLRKPRPGILLAECHLLKLGRRLAVGEIAIRSEGEEEMVAHATTTFSIPDAKL